MTTEKLAEVETLLGEMRPEEGSCKFLLRFSPASGLEATVTGSGFEVKGPNAEFKYKHREKKPEERYIKNFYFWPSPNSDLLLPGNPKVLIETDYTSETGSPTTLRVLRVLENGREVARDLAYLKFSFIPECDITKLFKKPSSYEDRIFFNREKIDRELRNEGLLSLAQDAVRKARTELKVDEVYQRFLAEREKAIKLSRLQPVERTLRLYLGK